MDELTYTNIPGSRSHERLQDSKEPLAAGITVITTLNIQHREGPKEILQVQVIQPAFSTDGRDVHATSP